MYRNDRQVVLVTEDRSEVYYLHRNCIVITKNVVTLVDFQRTNVKTSDCHGSM